MNRSPESNLAQVAEEEAWKEILSAGGSELIVPARDELTTQFIVPKGSILQWQFRVEAFDIGFALRLRAQADGGASESDVFALQRYDSGVTVRGEWSPTHDSVLVVVWHNKFSMLRSKKVVFQATVRQASLEAVDDAVSSIYACKPGAEEGEEASPKPEPEQEVDLPVPGAASIGNVEAEPPAAPTAARDAVRG